MRKMEWQQDIQESTTALDTTLMTTQLGSTSMTDMGKNYHPFIILVASMDDFHKSNSASKF